MRVPRPSSPAIWLPAGAAVCALLLAATWLDVAIPRAHAANSDLLFSEYVEGSSTNKALELYNGTGAPITLDGVYDIQIFANGSSSATATIPLVGTVADGDTFVLARAGADPDLVARADQSTANFLFNGNDAIVVRRTGVAVDVIGQIGADPGSAWQNGAVQTVDQTLRRRVDVTSGDADGSDAFDPAAEWLGFPVDTFDGLGEHEAGQPPNQPPAPLPDSARAAHEPVRLDVLANDGDPDGDPLIIVSVSPAALGAVHIVDEGRSIEYTPPAESWTRDTFEYDVSDPSGATTSARVEIEFDGTPEPADPCAAPATLTGTDGADVLFGTRGDDVIQAGAGNDLLFGLGGDDILCGGAGNDLISGGTGDDLLVDSAGRTIALGGRGDDQITTGDERDVVRAASGDDLVATGGGRDWIHAGRGDDTIDPGAGADVVNGGAGTDTCTLEQDDRARGCP